MVILVKQVFPEDTCFWLFLPESISTVDKLDYKIFKMIQLLINLIFLLCNIAALQNIFDESSLGLWSSC